MALILVFSCDLWIFVVEPVVVPSSGDLEKALFLVFEIVWNGAPFFSGVPFSPYSERHFLLIQSVIFERSAIFCSKIEHRTKMERRSRARNLTLVPDLALR